MKTYPISEVFNGLEAGNAPLTDSRGEHVTPKRISAGQVSAYAIAKATGAALLFFWLREDTSIGTQGYTIVQYDVAAETARPVSMPAQFMCERYANEACEAYAIGRIDEESAIGAHRSRQADNVASIILFKRNSARSDSLKDYRDAQKTRIIPHKKENRVAWLANWITENMEPADITALIKKLA